MENLTKTQFILLVLLVSFVTSLVTGIVTATLVSQAPPLMTQSITKILEKTIEKDSPQAQQALPIAASQQDLIVKIVNNVSSAVVSVIATKDLPVIEQYYVNPFEQDEFFRQFVPPELLPQLQIPQYRQKGTEKKQVSSGTGFFVSSDGLIVTNKHVVADSEADYSIVMNSGKSMKAKVLALDPVQDIAVLKVDVPEKGSYNFVPLEDSNNLQVGQTVIAIGNALGEFQNTVSVGVVSGLHRSVVASSGSQSEVLQDLIQTDAAVNPGNSGGPLLNLNGRAVGINTAMAESAQSIGFALPISFVRKDLADIKSTGKIQHAYLGIRYLIINVQIQEEKKLTVDYGALLIKNKNGEAAVMPASPAEKAGLKEGDIILEFNNSKITQNNSLAGLISSSCAGDTIKLKVLREGKILDISAVLESRPSDIK